MSIRVDTDAANKFSFRKRRERLDWRTLGSIQVEAVINNADVSLLQEILDNVAFCDLEYEDLRSVDRSFVKLFRLAQLIIEYLLFCQSTLVGVNKNLESEKTNLQQALADAQSGLKSKDSEVLALKKQLRSLQKVNQTYQLMAKASPGSDQRPAISVQKPTNSSQYERCPYCRKVFCTFGYLESHIRRRHPAEHVPYPCNPRREEGELPGSFFRILEVLGERLVDKLTANSTDTTKKDLELIRSTIEQTIVNQQSVQKDKLNLDRQIQELKV
ncbi:Iguana/Dzip1-like DAZ-interacting protein N-terminal-domain-containing protein [Polychytrium aggregatum]|uniref:Iguana/Dzip1-like DAZ-interacting protein N-terminal-domain-containing protein n=1 Tax=Polychytrium aggregatum TaxID=110093 RepID=UPI0022FEF864|nr:Iguana/Dzip1-like DAZ-interacting protein N-terminal-domain-containing protein [Polychytrium aggregatum]KAI9207401.1 Iguana/Dzip1-like DAZ-interacting protein N-terminal-domain-containing protein [Polychytrium aggregatum]